MRATKIVCTLGPASRAPETIRSLIRAGMDVARLNFSHGDHATKAELIHSVRRIAEEEGRHVAILADLQGPKLRVGVLPPAGLVLEEGATVSLSPGEDPGEGIVPVPHPDLLGALVPGDRVLFDDGALEVVVEARTDAGCTCRVVSGGILHSHKGINVPGGSLSLSPLTQKDREDLAFALAHGVDLVALSFVRRAADIRALRGLLLERDTHTPIVAKIEKAEALEAFDDILPEADAIMVARGDLGVETRAEEVPFHQKRIIRSCLRVGTPVITATQMLQSMIEHPRPTRAEASDVANAILDGTDAVMLSGETAVGRYPIEAVQTMARICEHAESHGVRGAPMEATHEGPTALTRAICQSAVQLARGVGAKAIITPTMSGTTARMVARHRPPVPVIALTPHPSTLRGLSFVWGVVPFLVPHPGNTDSLMRIALTLARDKGLAHPGERIVLTAGIPFGGGGQTNTVQVLTVGEG